jgi:two-component system, response regulator, stage 0 sporulation protein F
MWYQQAVEHARQSRKPSRHGYARRLKPLSYPPPRPVTCQDVRFEGRIVHALCIPLPVLITSRRLCHSDIIVTRHTTYLSLQVFLTSITRGFTVLQIHLSLSQYISMLDATNPTILIIENEEEIRRLYTDMLSYTGARFLEAGNPCEAFDYLRTHSVTLILTDLHMPGGGLQYLASLRAQEPTSPIVTITGLGGDDTIREATMIAGATEFLEKPIRTKQLRQVVDRFLLSRPIAV